MDEQDRVSTQHHPLSPAPPVTNLWYELEDGVGEERPDGQADKVGQHFGEIRLLGEGDEEEAEQRRQVDDGDGQEAVTPNCEGRKENMMKIQLAVERGHGDTSSWSHTLLLSFCYTVSICYHITVTRQTFDSTKTRHYLFAEEEFSARGR